jgi:TolA-binding protein
MNVSRTLALAFTLAAAMSTAAVVAQVPLQQRGPVTAVLQPSEPLQLAQQYVKAVKDDDKRNIRKQLAETLSQQFDAHLQEQKSELAELEKKIADLRALLNKRQEAKTSIVERRIEQLVQEAEGLGWNTPGSPRYVVNPYVVNPTQRPRTQQDGLFRPANDNSQ